MNTKQKRGNGKKLIAYENRYFFLSTCIGNPSQYDFAGFINRNSCDGKNPSKHGNNDFKMKMSFEIHWKTKSETIVWVIILLCSGILLLWDNK